MIPLCTWAENEHSKQDYETFTVDVAEGRADIYPRLAPTSEWDVAAGHALVTAAGGKITDADGGAVRFGNAASGFIVPEFIAWGDPSAAYRR